MKTSSSLQSLIKVLASPRPKSRGSSDVFRDWPVPETSPEPDSACTSHDGSWRPTEARSGWKAGRARGQPSLSPSPETVQPGRRRLSAGGRSGGDNGNGIHPYPDRRRSPHVLRSPTLAPGGSRGRRDRRLGPDGGGSSG